jgi:hypothetical protein
MSIDEFKLYMQTQLKMIKDNLKDDYYSENSNYYVMQWIENNAKNFRHNWMKKKH